MSKALTQQAEVPAESLLQYLREHVTADRFIPLNQDQIWYIASLVAEYMRCTPRGKRALMKELKVQEIPADFAKQYFPDGCLGDDSKRLDPRKLIKFEGWFYEWTDRDGYHFTSQPANKIEIYDRPELEACEHCNTQVLKSYCSSVVRDMVAGRDTLRTLCNRCKLYSDNPRVRDNANQRTCDECRLTGCQFHPKRIAATQPHRSLYDMASQPQPPMPSAPPPQIEHKPPMQAQWMNQDFSRI